MIARYARIEEVRRLKYKDHVVSNSVRLIADGIDEWIVLHTPEEVLEAERMLEAGKRVVFTISEETAP